MLLSPRERDPVTIPRLRPAEDKLETSASGVRVRPSLRSTVYRLSAPIGVGGTSTVHLGVRADDPSRVYAIKRLHPQLAADQGFAQLLLDEAAIAARIRHENVVAVHGASMVGGDLALVMDFRAGVSLAELIEALYPRKLPPRIATAIIAGALRGLHAAHEAVDEAGRSLGIVHRDVSPQNVHVGVDGVARVLDFGIAKARNRAQTTRAGEIRGKLGYMAPEQLRAGRIDRRVDIRAAAVVLWETLTCMPLFHGSNEGETIARVLDGCSTPPSELAADVPPALDAVILRALSQRTDDRFATALEMAEALDAVFGARRAHPNEIGAWLTAFAAGALREQWNVRTQLVESSSTFAPAEITTLMPVPSCPTPVSSRPPPRAPSPEPDPVPASKHGLETIAVGMLVVVLIVLAVLTDRAIHDRTWAHRSSLPERGVTHSPVSDIASIHGEAP
jgi:serine/threonine-protein kinase